MAGGYKPIRFLRERNRVFRVRDRDPEGQSGSDLDVGAAIAEAEAQLENKRVTRDEKVAALAEKTALVINGVVGIPPLCGKP